MASFTEPAAATPESYVEPGSYPKIKFASNHALLSKQAGESEVEKVTLAIEKRRDDRVVITRDVRRALLEDCRQIALDNNYEIKSKITMSDLQEYRDRTREELEIQKKRPFYFLLTFLGFWNLNEQLVRILDRAVNLVDAQGDDDRYFHYMDFNEYFTRVESRWPWMRSGVRIALLYVVAFYIFTPIFFCGLVRDPGICPKSPKGAKINWTSSLLFASETLSTVGYGDLVVNKENPSHVFAGIVYMIVANITLISAFSVALEAGWYPLAKWHEKVVDRIMGEARYDEHLHIKLRRVKFLRLTELVGGFLVLNLVGVIANRIFLLTSNETLETNWTWLVSIYWAVQTTTTIGYGDLDQPINQRWFNVFYLVFSTYFVGSALGGLAGLRNELEQVRVEYAWARRQNISIDKKLVRAEDHEDDGKIDQYEFLVASLVQLGKISSEDVIPIMDKYRSMAGDSGFIEHKSNVPDPTDQEIQDAIDAQTPRISMIPFTNQRIHVPSIRRQRAAARRRGSIVTTTMRVSTRGIETVETVASTTKEKEEGVPVLASSLVTGNQNENSFVANVAASTAGNKPSV